MSAAAPARDVPPQGLPRLPEGARLAPLAFADLPGWRQDETLAAFAAFRRTCEALTRAEAPLRAGAPVPPGLIAACRAALTAPPAGNDAARSFFERHFSPFEIVMEAGAFFTGYYEPEIEGSRERRPGFETPVHARPHDLVNLTDDTRPAHLSGLASARATQAGLQPFATRAQIEEGALDGLGLEILWLRDAPERFIVQVQGSARVRLPDGSVTRLRYGGRNGHPYTSIGRILVERGAIPKDEMSLERLMGWLRANPEEGRKVMRENASYIFFALDDTLAPREGPIGGAGVALTQGRSIAIDRTLWAYGLPFLAAFDAPLADGGSQTLARLTIAQDTGTAIVGPARVDFFYGSGAAAGTRAGLTRHRGRLFVLWPRPSGTTQAAP
jgi:membrane-bound lytic murein transglycosylase A